MIAIGKWFVMMYDQKIEGVMPIIDDDGEVMLWKTEGQANDFAKQHSYASAFGFQAYEVGA